MGKVLAGFKGAGLFFIRVVLLQAIGHLFFKQADIGGIFIGKYFPVFGKIRAKEYLRFFKADAVQLFLKKFIQGLGNGFTASEVTIFLSHKHDETGEVKNDTH